MTRLERFLAKVEVDEESGCWLWRARLDANGYARFNRGTGLSPMAHRFAYEHFVGQIPAGLQLDHLCRVRCCVNPAHLEVVTNRENALRGESFAAKNAAKTTCIYGHPLEGENLHLISRARGPERECRICARRRKRAYKHRRRAA